MSYYKDVYLKRINRDGVTQQERVKTRKEREFDRLFLQKTEYQVKVYSIDENEANIVGSLQPNVNKWNESELISKLLISTKEKPLKTGMILSIYQRIKEIEYDKKWLIVFCDENITRGYYSYKVICLDSIVNITNEYGDTMYSIPVKFVNATAALVKDLFSFSDEAGAYREPDREIRMITKNFDFLQKDAYFTYKEKGFKITGKDDISIDDVAYISLAETLFTEPEPRSSENIPVSEDVNFFLNNR